MMSAMRRRLRPFSRLLLSRMRTIDQAGNDEKEIRSQGEDVVEPSAHVAPVHTDERPEDGRDGSGDEAYEERRAETGHEEREHVATEMIGTEKMFP